ncbi:hypothetical protein TNCV_3150561 [Trichonephila clavipes]|nr:hypothetical protein TNCV_3150561 [Trichonephila clavipes]
MPTCCKDCSRLLLSTNRLFVRGERLVKYYWPSKRRIFLSRNRSSCSAEQFHSDTSLETVDRRAPNNSKKWQWTMEGDVSA